MQQEASKTRIDKYLWAIRLFKTRAQAADACDKSKVKVNGTAIKASKNVLVGEEYEVKTEAKKLIIKTVAIIYQRVQYSDAIKCYEDITPPAEDDLVTFHAPSFSTGKRQSKIGRPTKKQRRNLDDYTEN